MPESAFKQLFGDIMFKMFPVKFLDYLRSSSKFKAGISEKLKKFWQFLQNLLYNKKRSEEFILILKILCFAFFNSNIWI